MRRRSFLIFASFFLEIESALLSIERVYVGNVSDGISEFNQFLLYQRQQQVEVLLFFL